jgi:hypothetical protein
VCVCVCVCVFDERLVCIPPDRAEQVTCEGVSVCVCLCVCVCVCVCLMSVWRAFHLTGRSKLHVCVYVCVCMCVCV